MCSHSQRKHFYERFQEFYQLLGEGCLSLFVVAKNRKNLNKIQNLIVQ